MCYRDAAGVEASAVTFGGMSPKQRQFYFELVPFSCGLIITLYLKKCCTALETRRLVCLVL